ncbi:DNA topoisomerase IV subunit A [Caldivirga maquilingensis]|uniref:Type 2 DNA topoisomerase 6 subunit A n=1 Tax=Caldivirga maquilingensis (strain ATCC 700844 / DSM 13496 / JCM 10307 / IC-167) TaxID=397948 RepID=A8M9F6_CALMQ|nr:DNA topoisomerase IV subunit A [Caldivirga maquilingensis]ABW02375.1 DNA topoisomerase (ATP-hydrolyzing) [Caldivirga maquilingensis IC-167]
MVKDRGEALKVLEDWGRSIVDYINKGEEPVMRIPARTLTNIIWDEKRKILVLGPKAIERRFLDLNEAKRFMQTTLMLKLIIQSIKENVYPTIRDLYYNGKHTMELNEPKLSKSFRENTWDEQSESNAVIEDIEVATGVLREEMGVSADVKGKVVGPIVVRSKGFEIDATKMGDTALSLPPNPDELDIVRMDAKYVLVVEKDAIFQRLNREGYWNSEKCLLVTAKGMPDRATRRFVRRLSEDYGLPVYVFTDGDPYGWYIYSVYRSGSIKLSYENERLATPDAKFIGVTASDISKYKISDNYVIKATDRDIKRAQELKKYPWFQSHEWKRELDLFLRTRKKVEIEALSTHGLKFLHEYLLDKIHNNKWIE